MFGHYAVCGDSYETMTWISLSGGKFHAALGMVNYQQIFKCGEKRTGIPAHSGRQTHYRLPWYNP